MEITDIRVRRVGGDGKLKAYVTVTFDGCFVVHNIKVIHGRSGVFIAMPSRRTKTGEYKDVAHPINSDFRTNLQETILRAYEDSRDDPASLDEDGDEQVPPDA
ncbi:MAG: septation protein SpoVG [Spirochaetaceae bacterium]|nr:MAG: septation protein SpoVG [Spirochaetaceae bacterium]